MLPLSNLSTLPEEERRLMKQTELKVTKRKRSKYLECPIPSIPFNFLSSQSACPVLSTAVISTHVIPPASSFVSPDTIISGTVSLISKDRFDVNLPHKEDVIKIFQTFSGAQNDGLTGNWNFPLVEHEKLMSALKSLYPAVVIQGLPSFVLEIFANLRTLQFVQDEPDLSSVDDMLVNALMPFQKEGIVFGILKNGRVLIADEMGLGKTIQTLGIAHYYFNEWPLLIVVPLSKRYHWRESIMEWLPSVSVGSISVIESSNDDFSSSQIVIISYDLLHERHHEFIGFKVVILDGSHRLKKFRSPRTKIVLTILHIANRAILLNGIPAFSQPIEMFPQIFGLNQTMIKHSQYGLRYCVKGGNNLTELTLILQATIMIRRLKSDVSTQLPSKLRKLRNLDKALKKHNIVQQNVVDVFFETKNVTQSELRRRFFEFYSQSVNFKLPAVCTYIRNVLTRDRKLLVFAYHRAMIEGVSKSLEAAKVKYIRIDSDASLEDKSYCVEQFQSVEDIRAAVVSIMAIDSNMFLTSSQHVIFAELHWNVGVLVLVEAEDRAFRIDQQDSVVVEYLLAKGTTDDILCPLVLDKLDMLNKPELNTKAFCVATNLF